MKDNFNRWGDLPEDPKPVEPKPVVKKPAPKPVVKKPEVAPLPKEDFSPPVEKPATVKVQDMKNVQDISRQRWTDGTGRVFQLDYGRSNGEFVLREVEKGK